MFILTLLQCILILWDGSIENIFVCRNSIQSIVDVLRQTFNNSRGMVRLLVNVVYSIVWFTVRFEQSCLQVEGDVEIVYNLVIGLNFDGKAM